MDRIVLLNWSAIGIAEQRCRRGENETLYSGREHRFEQGQRIRGVVPKKLFGDLHRLARFDQRRTHGAADGTRADYDDVLHSHPPAQIDAIPAAIFDPL